MKLRQLQFAQTISETRSFSRAAELCNATQPTLSNAIVQLEEELGGKLFTRTTRNVELTAFGAYLMPFIKAVLDGRRELQQAAAAYHDPVHKLLRIGFSPLVDARLLDRVLQPYRRRHPDLSVFFKECLLDDLSRRLSDNVIDLAILPAGRADRGLKNLGFYEDALYYLPGDNSTKAEGAGSLKISQLPETPIILTGGGCGLNGSLRGLFEEQNARLRAYPGQAMSYPVIEEWAELGIAAGILPAAKLSSSADWAIPLLLEDGRPAILSFDWVWSPEAQRQSHIKDLIDYLRSTVPALVAGGVEPQSTVKKSSR